MQRVDAVVAGAGPAGLATGIALRAGGWSVAVLDRARDVTDRGAAVALWGNGISALRTLGCAEPLLDGQAPLRSGSFRTWRGDLLARFPLSDVAPGHAFPLVAVARRELQTALVDALGASALRLSTSVTGFRQRRDRVQVELSDSSVLETRLLVGADGLRSTVRQRLAPAHRLSYTGVRTWVGIATGAPVPVDEFQHLAGRGGGAFWVPMRSGSVFWGLAARFRAPAGGGTLRGARDVPAAFSGWWPPVAALVRATPPDEVVRFDVWEVPPLPRWSRGRVVVVGDAAHAMMPHLAQGTCQALEDAVSLGACLAGDDDVRAALEAFEERRRGPASRMSRLSRTYARSLAIHDPVVRLLGGQGASARARRAVLAPLRAAVGSVPTAAAAS